MTRQPLMRRTGIISCLLFVFVFIVASCGSSTTGTLTVLRPDVSLRIASPQTGGANGNALAAALLMSTPLQGFRPDRPAIQMTGLELQQQIEGLARTHLEVPNGSSVEGSAFIRRLAAASGAPADQNDNGSNLDETLAAQLAKFSSLVGAGAGAGTDPNLHLSLFDWRDGSADFAGPGPGTAAAVRRATVQTATGEVSLAQVGRSMLARTLLATALLQRSRGSRPGETAAAGLQGLAMLQAVLAMEETLFSSLFTQGRVLEELTFPSDYDPLQTEVSWIPKVVAASVDPKLPGVTASYKLVDQASSLAAIAALMRAGAELSFYASGANPNPNLRDVFRGHPFGRKPSGGPGGGTLSGLRSGGLVTWESGVSKLFGLWCAGCHEAGRFPFGNFVLDSYAAVQRGGDRSGPITSSLPGGTVKPPIIVRGDPDNSVLYTILAETPPPTFVRMPQGGPFMRAGGDELKLVRQWILDGARSAPSGPPNIGVDLAIVMFKNLIALHLDAASGALFVRNDGDAEPIAWVDVAATGEVLQALAAMSHLAGVISEEGYDYGKTLRAIADFAVDQLSAASGEVSTSYDLARRHAVGDGDLLAHARLTAGLLAAGRVLQSADLQTRAAALATRLTGDFFDPTTGLFRSTIGQAGRRFTPLSLAAVTDALREMAHAGLAGAVETQQAFLARVLRVMVYSETAATGEVIGDGIADTDGDGIPEPAYAGGRFGRAPVFVGEIKEGEEPVVEAGPILWSKHVRPLFEAACTVCHLRGANRGGYRLDTPTALRRPGGSNPNMPLVVPGDPEGSYLYRKLVDRDPTAGAQMPLDSPPLAPHGRALVRRWILEGATAR